MRVAIPRSPRHEKEPDGVLVLCMRGTQMEGDGATNLHIIVSMVSLYPTRPDDRAVGDTTACVQQRGRIDRIFSTRQERTLQCYARFELLPGRNSHNYGSDSNTEETIMRLSQSDSA